MAVTQVTIKMHTQDQTLFQYCPKLVLFSADKSAVLLARRKGEADYDGVFSFVGGKVERSDGGLLEGMRREKIEEIGAAAKVKVCWTASCFTVWFEKKDGNVLIASHHVALYESGDIELNPGEYDEYAWVPLVDLEKFQPKIANIPEVVQAAQRLLSVLSDDDFSEI